MQAVSPLWAEADGGIEACCRAERPAGQAAWEGTQYCARGRQRGRGPSTAPGQAAWEGTQHCARFFPGAASLRCSLPAVPAPFALGCDGDSQGLTAVWPSGSLTRDACFTLCPFAAPAHPSPSAGHPLPASCLRICQLWRFTSADSTRCGPFLTGSHGALCVQGSPMLQQVSVLHALLGPRSRVDGPSCIRLWMNSWVVSTASYCDGSCRGHSCTVYLLERLFRPL